MSRLRAAFSSLAHSVSAPAPSSSMTSILPPVPEGDDVTSPVSQNGEERSVYSEIMLKTPPSGRLFNGIDRKSLPVLTLTLDVLRMLSIDGTTLQVISQMDGATTVEAIVENTDASQSDVLAILWDLSEAGMIVLVQSVPESCD